MTELIDANPLPIMAKVEFTNTFNILNPEQKEVVKTFLYSSLQSCLLDSDKRISEGYPDKCTDIMRGKISINLPINAMQDELPERTDEQILLQLSSGNREFYPARFLSKNNSPYFLELAEIYINSSRIEKIAILQFLQDLHLSIIPTRPAQEHVALLLSGQEPYGKS